MLLLIVIVFLLNNYSYSYSHNLNNVSILKEKNNIKNFVLYNKSNEKVEDVDDITRKYGLEAGIWKAFRSGGKIKPGDLLKKYGAAYLITSITLAIISYALCYVLVSKGIDVGAILSKIGIKSSSAASGAGTASIAYAIHKAASPIRFPPTVVLTPIISGWLQFPKKKETN
jgi:hypothetical protein